MSTISKFHPFRSFLWKRKFVPSVREYAKPTNTTFGYLGERSKSPKMQNVLSAPTAKKLSNDCARDNTKSPEWRLKSTLYMKLKNSPLNYILWRLYQNRFKSEKWWNRYVEFINNIYFNDKNT